MAVSDVNVCSMSVKPPLRMIGVFAALIALVLTAACTAAPTKTSNAGQSAPATSTAPEPKAATVSMSPAPGTTEVNPLSPITLTASYGVLSDVSVTNPDGAPVQGAMSADSATWTSAEPLGYAKAYTATATTTSFDGVITPFNATFDTLKPANKTKASLTPSKSGGTYGVGMPIIARFDEPIADKATAMQQMVVTTDPPVDGAWYWFSNYEAHWRPKDFWAPGTSVAVDINVYGVQVSEGLWGQEDTHTDFTIGDAMVSEIDNSNLQMRVYKNGELIKTMPASMGKAKYPTQSGVHVVQEKYEMKTMDSSTWGLPVDDPEGYVTDVPWATRISGSGEFVHSAPWSVSDQGVRNASHGCINLSMANGKWFYDNSNFGDIVTITGTPVKLQHGDAYMDWNIPWETWVQGGKN
ncbi:lipoprotein-anchoring transpeptidase ErfK/SrfK [Antricoccus suffuscus]|uniref:Lipoprotein-anchoring transpeptidase ErfK/SrfK n=2 Tax=Antricoccus suffuscus TaxID=1629062 RepID=A0A2T0ZYJ1_9ACTN|nr:lipoprotein-anchoring transpeptidase ErfK/SrfK [Antricoccus suffuscus]